MTDFSQVKIFTKLAFMLALCSTGACAAVESPRIKAIEVLMFLQHSGELSRPITGSETLWNIIAGGGDVAEPASSALLDIAISGPPNTFGKKQFVEVQVKSERTGKLLKRHRELLGVFSPTAETHVGIWLPSIGCEPIVITALINGDSKSITLPFKCGE